MNEIWTVLAEGDSLKALILTLRFADMLTPRKIKKRLQDDVKIIREDMNKANRTTASNFFSTKVHQNRELRRVSDHYIYPFLSKLSDLLDEAGYYEKGTTRLKSSDFKKLGDDNES